MTGQRGVDWRRPTGPRLPSSPPTRAPPSTAVRPPWRLSSAPLKAIVGETRRISKISTPTNTGGSPGSATSSPSTTTAPTGPDTPLFPLNATEIETFRFYCTLWHVIAHGLLPRQS
ncbi:hypothetical protein U1Q18_046049 [Sarracenia purpurea var. burkii]